MIRGIPYFGEDNNKILRDIENSVNNEEVEKYETLSEIIDIYGDKEVVVIIDNKWLTWMHDIIFNYKDKKCVIPYYKYKVYWSKDINIGNDNKGHLLTRREEIGVRYEYEYSEEEITELTKELAIYDINLQSRKIVRWNRWTDDTFDMEELYRRYLDSAYKDDELQFVKHLKGYHYIDKKAREFTNKEKYIREDLGLLDFKSLVYKADYRDVREYKYNQIMKQVGLIKELKRYEYRRQSFESLMLCIINQGSKPVNVNTDIQKQWEKLREGKLKYIKYGNEIKLIIKDYWFTQQSDNYKTWSRK